MKPLAGFVFSDRLRQKNCIVLYAEIKKEERR